MCTEEVLETTLFIHADGQNTANILAVLGHANMHIEGERAQEGEG
jgi:hypothetical protein